MIAELELRIADTIGAVPAAEWDACAGPINPFVSHAFLDALEQSRSTGAKSGWLAQHLVLRDQAGALQAVAPLYVKSHSQGEYVFDHGWAEAWHRAGGRYYPKLQIAVPFTPVPGPRLLVGAARNQDEMRAALGRALIAITGQSGFSSAHVTFAEDADIEALRTQGFMVRASLQYHWPNRGYDSFEQFLSTLASRKRKAIRKERQSVAALGLNIRAFEGEELKPDHWDAFFEFYMDTGGRKWGRPYLTRDFFARVGETMKSRIVLMLAEQEGRWVAGALNFKGPDCLYGRSWGCLEEHRFLHFELCYYQAIDYAIRHGLSRVEAGAQGEHKIQRGYLPVETPSAHWIEHEGFRDAIADFLRRETRAMEEEKRAILAYSPYAGERQ